MAPLFLTLVTNSSIIYNMYKTFNIELGHNSELTLQYELIDSPITNLWIDRMVLALAQYPLDEPDRFYGFYSLEQEQEKALDLIRKDIDIINNYKPIVERELDDVFDQDTLNYLHKIFEDYHGILDKQSSDFWNLAPLEVRKALADLNVHVHRCETAQRGVHPRFVCTWYGLPKTVQFDTQDILAYGELDITPGGLYVNYVEIGKTLENINDDKDTHIGVDAFRPFIHYSADFNAKFYERKYTTERNQELLECYHTHKDTFARNGYNNFDILKPYNFRVAQLTEPVTSVLSKIAEHQFVNKVYFNA